VNKAGYKYDEMVCISAGVIGGFKKKYPSAFRKMLEYGTPDEPELPGDPGDPASGNFFDGL
jgi:hypothetical protein